MGCFRVSIPFASGHSFEHSITSAQSAINIKSQSPSHRGTHSNPTIQTNFVVPVGNTELSQSPSHRGTHSNGMDLSTTPPWDDLGVSIPFASGHSFEPRVVHETTVINEGSTSQSPSHRGTHSNHTGCRAIRRAIRVWCVSIPFASGHSFEPTHTARGTHSNKSCKSPTRRWIASLNPLRIGALIRTLQFLTQADTAVLNSNLPDPRCQSCKTHFLN